MSQEVTLDFDDTANVLYARRSVSPTCTSKELEDDPGIIFSFNKQGEVVGVCITDATAIEKKYWEKIAARKLFPSDILAVLNAWFKKR